MMGIPKLLDILFPQRVQKREAEQARRWALEREEREKQRAMEQARKEMSIAIDEMRKLDGKYIHMDEIQSLKHVWEDCARELQQNYVARVILRDEYTVFLEMYQSLDKWSRENNQKYEEQEYRKHPELFDNVDGKKLDKQQRKAVLCDENRCLLVAGAGSGKTLTVAAKVRYLCEAKGIPPEDILVISYTTKAAKEVNERIQDKLGIHDVQAVTMHKLGRDIIKNATGEQLTVNENADKMVLQYFFKKILDDLGTIKNVLWFLACFYAVPADVGNCKTMGEIYEKEGVQDLETLKNAYIRYAKDPSESSESGECGPCYSEFGKNREETVIANFLYLQGIEYQYDRRYPYEDKGVYRKNYSPAFYLPEYNIYLEYVLLDRSGKNPFLSAVENKKYIDEIEQRRELHRKFGTNLIEIYFYDSKEGHLLEELDRKLKANGVEYRKPDRRDIYQTVYANGKNRYFRSFLNLCNSFLASYKTNGMNKQTLQDKVQERAEKRKDTPWENERDWRFCEVFLPLLDAYEQALKDKHLIDFSDMIRRATQLVEDGCKIPAYKWVIIDEYQDATLAQYQLVQAILKRTGAKLLCVGDDWQSIFRFAGSNLALFTHFEEYFGPAAIMRLEKTYRNSQQLNDFAGKIIMENPQQLKKNIRSAKSLERPVVVLPYRGTMRYKLKEVMDEILKNSGPETSIFMIGRYNMDETYLQESCLFRSAPDGKYIYLDSPQTPIRFLTIHRAKGLEADNVVFLNFRNGMLGFPSQMEDNPILNLVLSEPEDYPYAEERRLLYVALTRTRNREYIMVDQDHPSVFLREFRKSKLVDMRWKEEDQENPVYCPRCKTGVLEVREDSQHHQFVGCSNYPKCTYSLPDVSVLTVPRICPKCGGFLIPRQSKYGTFFGCSNYPNCKYTEEL